MSLAQLFTTLNSREGALKLGREAVESRVAACAQVIGPMTSVYRWEGGLEESEEFLCLLKTPDERVAELIQFVRDRHPYDTPEITTVSSEFVDERYLKWARAETA